MSWYANISTTLYDDAGIGNSRSLYEELFQNPLVNKVGVGEKDYFRLNSKRTELQEFDLGNQIKITDETGAPVILAIVMGSLGINRSDIDLLVNDTSDVDNEILNLKNLSKLYRKVSLARELKLSIPELLQIKDLTGINPFVSDSDLIPSSMHTANTLRFIEVVKKIRSSHFTVAELDYLLRNKEDMISTLRPTSEAMSLMLDEIRKGLQKIHMETTIAPDLDGELTKKKLALLKWDSTLIEETNQHNKRNTQL